MFPVSPIDNPHSSNGEVMTHQGLRYPPHSNQWGNKTVHEPSENFLNESHSSFLPFSALSSNHVPHKDLSHQTPYSKCIPHTPNHVYKPSDTFSTFNGYQSSNPFPRLFIGYENGCREKGGDVRSSDGPSDQNLLDMWNSQSIEGNRNVSPFSEQHLREYFARYINGMSSYGPPDYRMESQDRYRNYRPTSLNFYFDGQPQSIPQPSMSNRNSETSYRHEINNAYHQNLPSEALHADQNYPKSLPELPKLIPINNYTPENQINVENLIDMNSTTLTSEPMMHLSDPPAYFTGSYNNNMHPSYTDAGSMTRKMDIPSEIHRGSSPPKQMYTPLKSTAMYPSSQPHSMPIGNSFDGKYGNINACKDKSLGGPMSHNIQKNSPNSEHSVQNISNPITDNSNSTETEEVEVVPQFTHIPDWMVRWRRKAFKPKACGVCHKLARSSHFGGVCCDSCKAFFRRAVKSQTNIKFKCTYDG